MNLERYNINNIRKKYLNPDLTQKDKNIIDKKEIESDWEEIYKDFEVLGINKYKKQT